LGALVNALCETYQDNETYWAVAAQPNDLEQAAPPDSNAPGEASKRRE
jgi:hypothetical protein